MELDDLRTAWMDMDRKLQASLTMSRDALREVKTGKTQSALRWLGAELWYELVSGLTVALLLGYFLSRNVGDMRYAIPAVGLLAFVAWTMAVAIRQLAAIGSLDYGGPIVSIQRTLAGIRVLRAWSFRWILVLAPLLWTPLVIVVAKSLGFDIYKGFGSAWLAWNFALGIAFIVVAVWVSHRFGGWFQRSPTWQAIADSLAGRSIATAQGHVNEVVRFEAEA